MGNIIFREVETQTDLAILHDAIKVIWPEVFTSILGEEEVTYMVKNYQSIDKIRTEIADGAKYYLVELGGEVIGYTAYVIETDAVYISKFYLSASVRGQGISRKMFSWLMDIAKVNGKQKLSLRVNRGNARAISVYQHFDFEIIKKIDTPFGDFSLNDYLMEKQLTV